MDVIINELPTPNLGKDIYVCYPDTVYLSIAQGAKPDSATDRNYHTSWTFIHDKGAAYNPVSSHENAIDYVLTSTGKMAALMTDKRSGCFASDTMIVNVLDTLGVVVTHTAHTLPKYSCPGETDTLSFSYKQNENHPVSIAWYKNGALLRKSANGNDTVLVFSNFVNFDTVYAVVSLPFDCGSERAKDTAVFPLRRHITPKVELAWNGRDSVCAGDTVKMFVKILDNPDDTVDYTYQWYMNGVAVPAPLGQLDTLRYAPSAGASIACAVKANYGCSANIDGPVLTTNPGPSILPVPDPTIRTVDSVCPAKDFTLNVKAVKGGSYAWSSFDTIAHTFAQDTNVLVTSQTIPTQ
ncbi:MAG: hypothetical protein K2I83_04265, partial [Bacteroidales bacterium]|nr:hypothetical protein [Bacteroidales bacterium]